MSRTVSAICGVLCLSLTAASSQPVNFIVLTSSVGAPKFLQQWKDDNTALNQLTETGSRWNYQISSMIEIDSSNHGLNREKVCSAISETNGNLTVILDVSEKSQQVQEAAWRMDVPLISLQLRPERYLINAVDDYLRNLTASDAAFIFESEKAMKSSVSYVIGQSTLRVIFFPGLTDDVIRRIESMRPRPSYYAVIADASNIIEIYQRAIQSNLTRRESHWVLGFTDNEVGEFQDVVSPSFRVAYLSEDFPQSDQEYLSAFLEVVSAALDSVPEATFEEARKNFSALIQNCNLAQQGFQPTSFWTTAFAAALTEAAPLKPELSINVKKYGMHDFIEVLFQRNYLFWMEKSKIQQEKVEFARWDPSNKLTQIAGEQNVIKRFLRIGTVLAEPWAYIAYDEAGNQLFDEATGVPIYEGYCIDFIRSLSIAMKFDYEIVVTDKYGVKQSNGEMDGAVGALIHRDTDMIVASLTMTSEREEVIDFVAPYFDQSGIGIVIKKPVMETNIFKFLTVLKNEVWLSILGSVFLTGFLIWILDYFSPYSAQNQPDIKEGEFRKFTLKESFWFALTSFTPQGGGEAPKALSSRVLVAAYWLFVILMLATFTANLAAFLTVERMKNPLQSLEELAVQSKVNYSVMTGTSIQRYFENMANAEDELYRVWKQLTLNNNSDVYRVWDYPIKEQYTHILKKIKSGGMVNSSKAGFQKVLESNGDFAFIHDVLEIRHRVYRDCNMTEVGESFAEQPYAVAVQQGSHLQEEIGQVILDLQKQRYFEKLRSKYWNTTVRNQCPADVEDGISLYSLGGVFIVTVGGLVIAMVTLGIEVLYYSHKKMNGRVDKIKNIEVTPKAKIAFIH